MRALLAGFDFVEEGDWMFSLFLTPKSLRLSRSLDGGCGRKGGRVLEAMIGIEMRIEGDYSVVTLCSRMY